MQKKQNKTALIWFRNDLRVHDNVVLENAIEDGKNVADVGNDPKCNFIKKWVSEVKDLDLQFVREPYLLTETEQDSTIFD